ncbi:hypothetical protein Tsubulata_042927 [Turnera subulata]|uniref:WAT1-related protein n=1 Tax=Turnera subulata TaxID=218843 RepID=A0A9Q0FL27_9ROSI|nr:hypothetical protein Tsubulata_042927 [Turnera subulata]
MKYPEPQSTEIKIDEQSSLQRRSARAGSLEKVEERRRTRGGEEEEVRSRRGAGRSCQRDWAELHEGLAEPPRRAEPLRESVASMSQLRPTKRAVSTGAKIVGTLGSISGAIVVVLYRGPAILSASSSPNQHVLLQQPVGSPESNWIIGSVLLATRFILTAFWYIIQAQILKVYPEEISVAFFYNLGVAICSVLGCLAAGRRSWNLGSEIAVIAVIYSGIFASCINVVIHTWGVRIKGPVYVALFKPLSIAIAAIMSFIFLGDALYPGSVIGAVVISIGFYAVIWGKAQEQECSTQDNCSGSFGSSPDGKVPLLQSHKSEAV